MNNPMFAVPIRNYTSPCLANPLTLTQYSQYYTAVNNFPSPHQQQPCYTEYAPGYLNQFTPSSSSNTAAAAAGEFHTMESINHTISSNDEPYFTLIEPVSIDIETFTESNPNPAAATNQLIELAPQPLSLRHIVASTNQTNSLKLPTIPVSRVEILNQQILLGTAASSSSSSPPSSSSSAKRPRKSTSKSQQQSKGANGNAQERGEKNDECVICGDESSGYHYGAVTCEACKLFFKRKSLQNSNIKFTDCVDNKCNISSELRKNCSRCRYKKCIAMGMGIGRSRFGRNITESATKYALNANDELCLLLENIKKICSEQQSSLDVDFLGDQIQEFYEKSLKLLTPLSSSSSKNSTSTSPETARSSNKRPRLTTESNPLTHNNNDDICIVSHHITSTLTELTSLINNETRSRIVQLEKNDDRKLPEFVVAFFCVLFEIETDASERFEDLKREFREDVTLIKEVILKDIVFKDIIKIGIFIKLLRLLIFDEAEIINDSYNKRITDLMRSEFVMVKFGENFVPIEPSQTSCILIELCTVLKRFLNKLDHIV